MRDVGIIVWVVFIVIGVIANIASTVRKQAGARAPARVPPQSPALATPVRRAQPPTVAVPAPGVGVAAPRVAVAAPYALLHEGAPKPRRAFFADAPSVVRAVIAAEVLGKPRAFRDE